MSYHSINTSGSFSHQIAMISTISLREHFGVVTAGAALLGIGATSAVGASNSESADASPQPAVSTTSASSPIDKGGVADPTRVRRPIGRRHPIHHEITLSSFEVQ